MSKKPNMLFIMSDQHRHDYLGAAGASFVETPHLDGLARQGVRFTQCTTNAPVCAPARVALATGLQPWRLGALSNQCFLPPNQPTYYQRLRDGGYRVGCVGKLDLAKPDPYNGRRGDRPYVYKWGFTHPEECEGKMHAGSSPTPIGPYTHYLEEKGLLQKFYEDYRARSRVGWCRDARDSVLPTEDFEDTYIGRRAAEWIDTIADDYPWHLFVSFVGPHDPFDPPAEYGARYRGTDMPAPVEDDMEGKPAWVQNRVGGMTPAEIETSRRQYCAATTLIDDQVGAILAALERRGMRQNTFIVYASDHGEMLGDHGLFTKSLAYEASLRVPLIATGPGIEAGRTSDALVELIDVNATLCELSGLGPHEGMDARSFAPILRGDFEVHRDETVGALHHFQCVRTAAHKVVLNHQGPTELYDLESDPDERRNIAANHPDLVQDLSQRLRQRFHESMGH